MWLLDYLKDKNRSDQMPFDVVCQFNELKQLTDKYSDSVIYFYQEIVKHRLTKYHIENELSYSTICQHDIILDRLYSIRQLYPEFKHEIYMTFYRLIMEVHFMRGAINGNEGLLIEVIKQLSFDELVAVIKKKNNKGFLSLLPIILAVINPTLNEYNTTDTRRVFQYMDIQFIRRMDRIMYQHVTDIIRDVVVPIVKFKSLKALRAAHENELEFHRKELALMKKTMLEHTGALENKVKSKGYYLPSSMEAILMRGRVHHNCVGNYAEKHCKLDNNLMTRLIFNDAATAEIVIGVTDEIVNGVDIRQYKGKYNKNYDVPLKLQQLCASLVGMHYTDFEVRRIEHD